MKTMTINQVIERLEAYKQNQGDIPVVLYDLDSGCYFSMLPAHFELQAVFGSARLSIGLNSYQDPGEPQTW
jgi:hypothetical protein